MADDKQLTPAQQGPIEEKAKRIVAQARMDLALDHIFFGRLVLQLQMKPDWTQPTACTNGDWIRYNPQYVVEHGYAKVKGVLCHEALHCAFGHIWREQDLPFPPMPKNAPTDLTVEQIEEVKIVMRHDKANRAADYAINPIVLDSGMVLPEGVLVDAKYKGKSMEEIYYELPDPPVQFMSCSGGGATAKPTGQPRCGDMEPQDGSTPDGQQRQQEWQGVTAQAAQAAKNQGSLPAGLEQLIERFNKPQIDFRARLRRMVQQAFNNDDYTWRRPNRRFLPHGLYMPSMFSERVGVLAIGQDTSGSMWDQHSMTACASEICGIVEDIQPEKTVLYHCDAEVASHQEFAPGDSFEFKPKGGGGTSFVPVFTRIKKDGLEPTCLIYFTDLMGTFPDEPPPYPVIWVTTEKGEAPFGEVLEIDIHKL